MLFVSYAFICLLIMIYTTKGIEFELHPQKLDQLFHRAAMMALLKAKAKEILQKMPHIERILFAECLGNNHGEAARIPAKYAQCLVKLFEARNANKIGTYSRIRHMPMANVGGEPGGIVETAVKWMANLAKIFQTENWNPMQKIYGRRKKEEESKRKKIQRKRREAPAGEVSIGKSRMKNIGMLAKLQEYVEQLDWANAFMQKLSKQNMNKMRHYLPDLKGPIQMAGDSMNSAFGLANQLASILISTFGMSSISVLSPRLLSLFPSSANGKRRRILSPELFSFQEDGKGNGLLSLPKIFRDMHLGHAETLEWIEFLLEISGNGKQLEKLTQQLGPEQKNFRERIFPAIQKVARLDEKIERMKRELNRRQRREIRTRGYTLLNREQWMMKQSTATENEDEDEEEGIYTISEAALEERIREMAKLADELPAQTNETQRPELSFQTNGRGRDATFADPTFADDDKLTVSIGSRSCVHEKPIICKSRICKRRVAGRGTVVIGGITQNGTNVPEVGGEAPDEEDGEFPRTVILTPSAFVHRVDGVILEGVYLSPHAFATEIISPEFLTIHALTPAAFVAVILSPMAMTLRLLSPWAFRAEILSPEAFSAYVLNPDVFMAEILSPKAFEPRVLSPKSMFMQILTPFAASPRIGSPESVGLLVLSPNFLSPRINSTESLLVEVLSPHILGGAHEHHEDDHSEANGAVHIVGSGAISHHSGHHNEQEEHGGHGGGHTNNQENEGHEAGGHQPEQQEHSIGENNNNNNQVDAADDGDQSHEA